MYQVEKNSKRKYAINLSHIAKIAGVLCGFEEILTASLLFWKGTIPIVRLIVPPPIGYGQ